MFEKMMQAEWKPWWIWFWYLATAGWVGYGLYSADFTRGGAAFLLLFGVPETIGVWRGGDAYPPLTHVIRNQFPSWVAFPAILAVVGGVGARWANLDWRATFFVALILGAAGWLIEHFLAVYDADDPRPSAVRRATDRRPG